MFVYNEQFIVLDLNVDFIESLVLVIIFVLNFINVMYKLDFGGSCQQCFVESFVEIVYCVVYYISVIILCVFIIEVGVENLWYDEKKKNLKMR